MCVLFSARCMGRVEARRDRYYDTSISASTAPDSVLPLYHPCIRQTGIILLLSLPLSSLVNLEAHTSGRGFCLFDVHAEPIKVPPDWAQLSRPLVLDQHREIVTIEHKRLDDIFKAFAGVVSQANFSRLFDRRYVLLRFRYQAAINTIFDFTRNSLTHQPCPRS